MYLENTMLVDDLVTRTSAGLVMIYVVRIQYMDGTSSGKAKSHNQITTALLVTGKVITGHLWLGTALDPYWSI